jgi:hypothetical protein
MKKNSLAQHGEIIFLVALILLGAYIFYRTFFLPPSFHQILGAAAYPRFIVGFLSILCLIILAQKLKEKPAAPEGSKPGQPTDARPPLLISALLVIAYGLGFSFLGYFVSSFIFIVVLIYVLSGYLPRIIPWATLISAAVTAFMYLFLVQFLDIYFPETWLF